MNARNRFFAAILCLALCLSLCACGTKEEPAPVSTPAPVQETAVPTEAPIEEAAEPEAPAEEAVDLKAVAESYIDKDVSELFAAIGEPLESLYAPSCLGDGEDGEHRYEGFTVYTYKEGESEIVRVVI